MTMNQNSFKCHLCGHDCCEKREPSIPDLSLCTCPNCGDYGVQDDVLGDNPRDQRIRFKAACIAVERKLRDRDNYVIVEKEEGKTVAGRPTISIDRLISAYPTKPTELLNRSLLNLDRMIKHPGDKIDLTVNSRFAFFSSEYLQMRYVLRQFEILGYINVVSETTEGNIDLYIESAGWERINELTKTTGADSNQAFVAMWFDPTMNDVFDNGIAPAIDEDCGIKPVKIDLKEFNDDVVDEIVAEIKRSRFMVADFTGERQNVYFEAGFARGLGIPVIWLVQKGEKLHFDTRQFNHIVYEGSEDLRKKLANRIKATVL